MATGSSLLGYRSHAFSVLWALQVRGRPLTAVRTISDTYVIGHELMIISQLIAHASREGWQNVNNSMVEPRRAGNTAPVQASQPSGSWTHIS